MVLEVGTNRFDCLHCLRSLSCRLRVCSRWYELIDGRNNLVDMVPFPRRSRGTLIVGNGSRSRTCIFGLSL